MQGFKSFAKRTEVRFDKGINVVVGANGSGKSNLSDALCFVLGRLSVKSMRASKAKNLIFMGSKYVKPSREAVVELVFDNSDRAFAIECDEVSLKRIVRFNGQGMYKINDEVKTRSEVIETLAQAGIDPYGFNIILQGQIQSIVKMHPEERRKIVEEVAGIAIYESRKEKSLKELEKTDERLKEISATLRERTAYLRNLEKEKSQAERFKELQLTVQRAKTGILHKKKVEKEDELNSLVQSIESKEREKTTLRERSAALQQLLDRLQSEIQSINKRIQSSAGVEQETLRRAIAELKADLGGLGVRKENHTHRKGELERRIIEIEKSIPSLEQEIKGLREKSPLMAQKAEEVRRKKQELGLLQEERRKLLTLKSELHGVRERAKDKERQIERLRAEAAYVLQQMSNEQEKLRYKNYESCGEAHATFSKVLKEEQLHLMHSAKALLDFERTISISDAEIRRLEKVQNDVEKLDVCPLCQHVITGDHKQHVFGETGEGIGAARKQLEESRRSLKETEAKRDKSQKYVVELEKELSRCALEQMQHRALLEKQQRYKQLGSDEHLLLAEIKGLDGQRAMLEGKTVDSSSLEERYEAALLALEEISSRTEEDVDTTLLYKERELERMQGIAKQTKKDLEETDSVLQDLEETLHLKQAHLVEREKLDAKMQEQFKQLFEERDEQQKHYQEQSIALQEQQGNTRSLEEQINFFRIGKAKLDAEREAIELELREFSGVEPLAGSLHYLEERLQKSQEALMQIGSINMRALEVFESVKGEYEKVVEKVAILEREKIDILKIVEEIDIKKKRTFMKTFRGINALFTENFSKLYTKGVAFLEPDNKEDLFAGGINIVVKLAKGKYFDVTSLSGGEQTLVALSLLFAIQEFKPYHFYIFDEIDAALDKRNSEQLAGLLNQYMQAGQYLVVTHNDAIILNANVLYGVSMHEGVSKILSLQLQDKVASGIGSSLTSDVTDVTELEDKAVDSLRVEEVEATIAGETRELKPEVEMKVEGTIKNEVGEEV